nr:MAG: hypothetical protein DIU75_20830 [Mycolicibacterium hassiacum]
MRGILCGAAAIASAVHISSDPPVPGRFYWISDTELRWRPQENGNLVGTAARIRGELANFFSRALSVFAGSGFTRSSLFAAQSPRWADQDWLGSVRRSDSTMSDKEN